MSLFDKVKENLHDTATKAKEGVEGIQTKIELGQTYGDLGRKAFELIDAGALPATGLEAEIDRIRKLKAQLESEQAPAAPAA